VKKRAFLGNAIESRCRDPFRSVSGGVRIGLIVGDTEQNIRPPRIGGRLLSGGKYGWRCRGGMEKLAASEGTGGRRVAHFEIVAE
jgi:hypothetical protein